MENGLNGVEFPLIRKTLGGKILRLRPVGTTDVEQSLAFVRGLSYGARYFRFGRSDIRFPVEEVAWVCHETAKSERHFMVLAEQDDAEIQIASARYHIDPDVFSGELAIVVSESWQRTGVADWLMQTLIESARGIGLKTLIARTYGSNVRMRKFAQKHGFQRDASCEGEAIHELTLNLGEGLPLPEPVPSRK